MKHPTVTAHLSTSHNKLSQEIAAIATTLSKRATSLAPTSYRTQDEIPHSLNIAGIYMCGGLSVPTTPAWKGHSSNMTSSYIAGDYPSAVNGDSTPPSSPYGRRSHTNFFHPHPNTLQMTNPQLHVHHHPFSSRDKDRDKDHHHHYSRQPGTPPPKHRLKLSFPLHRSKSHESNLANRILQAGQTTNPTNPPTQSGNPSVSGTSGYLDAVHNFDPTTSSPGPLSSVNTSVSPDAFTSNSGDFFRFNDSNGPVNSSFSSNTLHFPAVLTANGFSSKIVTSGCYFPTLDRPGCVIPITTKSNNSSLLEASFVFEENLNNGCPGFIDIDKNRRNSFESRLSKSHNCQATIPTSLPINSDGFLTAPTIYSSNQALNSGTCITNISGYAHK
ncbi:unnamed protein product [Protopolystoma xenopodis]|uniref:Uncharacterized protein n=1 Tax=Protopolystoma xenopodis TaxID=117903 RepID=A0A448X1I1_9PLAT|nr:unnamed protein product [Protopolystoma xenopodis]